jgi:cytoplasmic iron level regulating protein YaaA (DUF328/UPF0246 family)
MKVLLSPAKSMRESCIEHSYTEIPFKKETSILLKNMKKMTAKDISKLMKVSEQIGELNYKRFQNFNNQEQRACIYYFDGAVYKGLDIDSFSKKELNRAQKTLRILSGMYGILNPLDGIVPYRLEMGTKVKIANSKNLYEFWRTKVTAKLKESLKKDELIINLASKEYSDVINFSDLSNQTIHPVFKEKKGDSYKIVAIHAKRARGLMAKYIINKNITGIKELLKFNLEGYRYSKELSLKNSPVFIRN